MRGTIRDVELHWSNNPNMAIRIRTPIYMARVGVTNVSFDLHFAFTGRERAEIGSVQLQIGNDRVYIYEGQQFIDPTRTEYIRASDTIRNLNIYAGAGVTVTRNITRDTSIYVQAEIATHYAWDVLFQQHSELVDIILMHESGMQHAQSTVSIDRPRTYFVYDSERRLIGTTDDTDLPFSPVYYLAVAMIEIAGDIIPEDPASWDPDLFEPTPGLGGDGGGTGNVNYNPRTSR